MNFEKKIDVSFKLNHYGTMLSAKDDSNTMVRFVDRGLSWNGWLTVHSQDC